MCRTLTTVSRVSALTPHRIAVTWCVVMALAATGVDAADPTTERAAPATEVLAPIGPADLPDELPGRWLVSLCVSDSNDHAWIRFENPETGEIRSIGRYHLLVGGWFDREHRRWNYGPTLRTGLHMDREQEREPELADGSEILRSKWVDNPRIYVARGPRGHALVRNNCATYARDAWQFYSGEYWELPVIHTPKALRESVGQEHPEVLTVSRHRSKRDAGRWGR